MGVPKTIDNDLAGTDFTFGFDTAVNIATEAIDRVHTTAEAHNRVMVVEVMGRDSGWIAMYSGMAGGADVILIPEIPFDIDKVAETIRQRHARGRYFSIVVVAEGAKFAADVDADRSSHRAGHGQRRIRACAAGRNRQSWRGKLKSAQISRPDRWSWDTSSAAVRPVRSIACWPRGTGWAPSTWCIAQSGAAWRRCAGTRSSSVPLADAIASNRKVDPELIEVANGILDKLVKENEPAMQK